MSQPIPKAPTLPARKPLLGISTAPKRRPARVILIAGEKWGKSSWAAHAPAPIFLMSKGETGLLTLIERGLVPAGTPYFDPDCHTFVDAKNRVQQLIDAEHDRQTLVIDVGTGLTRMAETVICERVYKGEWADHEEFGRGAKATIPLVSAFVDLLDRLRNVRNMGIIVLMHAKIRTQKNPEGPDYDRWIPELPDCLWGPFHKWADAILFGHTVIAAEKDRGAQKAKGSGGRQRILCTQPNAAYVAGNRYDLPEIIDGGANAAECWTNFATAMKQRKETDQ